MRKLEIANRQVGQGEPCFIVAEAGINHDGKLEQAKELVWAAAKAGADAIKFQTFSAEKRVSSKTSKAKYIETSTGAKESLYDFFKRLELSKADHQELIKVTREEGIIFMSTAFDEASADLLEELGVAAFKIASFDIVNLPLLEHVARKSRPMIVSTGGATLGEVEEAVSVIKATGNNAIVLLHCTASYPAAFPDINLKAMKTIADAFQCLVGYSDHSLGITVPLGAVALGASVVEKHFTLDRSLPGPDHSFSADPSEFQNMVRSIRNLEKAMGSPLKQPVPAEKEIIQVARKCLVANQDIPAGTVITNDMLTVKGHGVGLVPKYANVVVGKKARADIECDEAITWDKI